MLNALFSNAQPTKHIGCHHTHNSGAKRQALSLEQRSQLNESIARSDTFDILSYLINIDVTNYVGHYIKASTTIAVHPLISDQSILHLDLYQLQVDSVKMNDEHLPFSYDGNILSLHFSTPLSVSDTLEVITYYQGDPYQDPNWGGFYFESNYIYNLGIGLTTIPPNFGRVWYPCFDSFVERATYEYHVKSAGTYRAHCQGTFIGETALAGDTVIRSFVFNQPIPTHLSAIAVADYVNYDYTHTGANGDIPVRLSAKPAQSGAMQNVFQHLGSAIDACEYWYGPYAWERVGYVLTTDGALEIPTNIAYPQYMVGESLSANDGLMSHELGHHWWGDMVTPHNHNDMWLKEGPAEYSSHLMEEWMNGNEDFVKMVKTNQLDVLENAHLDDNGFHPLSPMPDEEIYGTHTYYKGASVMHNLRGYMGDSLFRQAMTGVQENWQYQDVTPEEFRDALEAESGFDLDDFFNDQIFSPGFSTFVVDSFLTVAGETGYDIQVHIQQKLRECPQFYQNVPLDVTLISSDWQRAEYKILASDQFTQASLYCDFEPSMVVLNGHNRLNQCRMDLDLTVYPNVSIYPVLPFVEFRFNKENVVDSSLVRIEHIWAAPDQNNIGDGIYEISNVHYWIVNGLWNENDFFTGRLYYNGSDADELDYDMYNAGESEAVLLYRPDSYHAWEICPDFTLGVGSLTNGDGSFIIDTLRIGQYAFANGDITIATNEVEKNDNQSLLLYPVPTNDVLRIKGSWGKKETALFDIYSSSGALLLRSSGLVGDTFEKQINVQELPIGSYLLQIKNSSGEQIGISQFIVDGAR
jgi:hypothetical protein